MRISDWSSDVCSSDLLPARYGQTADQPVHAMSLLLRFPKGLYGVTPEWDDTDKLLAAIRAAAAGGMAALQWRRKTAKANEGLEKVRQENDREACRERVSQ